MRYLYVEDLFTLTYKLLLLKEDLCSVICYVVVVIGVESIHNFN